MRDRYSTNTFGDCSARNRRNFRIIDFAAAEPRPDLLREVSPHPFLPSDPETLATRCWETFEIQSNALATRIQAIGDTQLILGVSGGIDSTHALLASVAALDLLGRDRSQLHCITMPGLGTTTATRNNAELLCKTVGATFREIGVSELSHLVLKAIEHPAVDGTETVDELLEKLRADPDLGNVALENVQARLRTLVLMALANQLRGIVIGTGDLSEKALGWSTYSGDHISMYDVNCGVPKTLIQFVIRWVANERAGLWANGEPLKRFVRHFSKFWIPPYLPSFYRRMPQEKLLNSPKTPLGLMNFTTFSCSILCVTAQRQAESWIWHLLLLMDAMNRTP